MYCGLSTCLCVKQVSGPRSVFRLPESGGNDATEELASAWRREFLATNYIRALQHPPYSPCRLFSLLENKEWPGWCFYHPLDLQDGAGTGSTEYRRKWVYRSLPEIATLPWKVHCPPGWICREILKNKVPPISYSFCFIRPFASVIEHTSYECRNWET